MRLSALLILLIVHSLCLGQGDLSKVEFKTFTSNKGKFAVLFPGEPLHQQKQSPTPLGEVTLEIDLVPFGQGGAFIVCYNDYPNQIRDEDPVKLLKGVRDGIKGEDGKIVQDDDSPFGPDKLPSRKFTIKKEGELLMKNLIVLNGNRLYQAMVVGEAKQVNAKEVEEKFYQSFSITK
jgi:hypothetical protein